ncbi:hypothetical protein BDDG_11810 [Blastomyces dermatitidis ATCC 18188]|uniref:Uncharacterized protein n=1 Tax=Ajellomyces dermatitidis (strain ATCC 18188 / CBS 674.68) TaxID=653446 RepID=A0A0J9EKR1_AJEDA|nr:hypothetical protein BDDG_11810 [Blastomyces dermatitidis ATCC 18188]
MARVDEVIPANFVTTTTTTDDDLIRPWMMLAPPDRISAVDTCISISSNKMPTSGGDGQDNKLGLGGLVGIAGLQPVIREIGGVRASTSAV